MESDLKGRVIIIYYNNPIILSIDGGQITSASGYFDCLCGDFIVLRHDTHSSTSYKTYHSIHHVVAICPVVRGDI